MDDFIILADTKAYLWGLLEKIKGFLSGLKLKLNPKTSIFPIERGIDFAGYRTWATHILPRKRNVKKFRRKAKWMMKAYADGKIDLSYIKPRLMSFLGYMKHCCAQTTVRIILEEFRVVRGECQFFSEN
ncbi:hypothetical protein [Hippea maritima]|uniref:hypothetical protein n=1 Tax=Hippea maritima TaxID=84405 RepID=UPI000302AC52|nr:hypothetical protein [Hippea maritima]